MYKVNRVCYNEFKRTVRPLPLLPAPVLRGGDGGGGGCGCGDQQQQHVKGGGVGEGGSILWALAAPVLVPAVVAAAVAAIVGTVGRGKRSRPLLVASRPLGAGRRAGASVRSSRVSKLPLRA